MAVFEYEALNSSGKTVKGIVEAESERAARNNLKSQGIFPTAFKASNKKVYDSKDLLRLVSSGEKKVGARKLAVASKQVETLLIAGTPVVESFRELSNQLEDNTLRKVFSEIATAVNEGSTLAKALEKHPRVFPKLYVNMVRAGEISGTLELIFGRLAELYDSQARLNQKVTSALTYPILMLILCFSAVLIILYFIIPEIRSLFDQRGATLPVPTQVVIALSEFVQFYWWLVLAAFVGLYLGFQKYYQSKLGRRSIDKLLLDLPYLGPFNRKLGATKLARNLSSLLASGVDLLQALTIARNIVSNTLLQEALDKAKVGVEEGVSLSKELKESGLFPSMLIHLIKTGENSGDLERMLLHSANTYDAEIDSFLAGITSVIEPILILFLTVVVGGILVSVLLPMLEMSSLVQ